MTTRRIGEIYSSKHTQYSEATQYCYYNGVHDLALFWTNPTPTEINGFLKQPVEVSLYVEGAVLFLLFRIVDICEWSDVAYKNISTLTLLILQLVESENIYYGGGGSCFGICGFLGGWRGY